MRGEEEVRRAHNPLVFPKNFGLVPYGKRYYDKKPSICFHNALWSQAAGTLKDRQTEMETFCQRCAGADLHPVRKINC